MKFCNAHSVLESRAWSFVKPMQPLSVYWRPGHEALYGTRSLSVCTGSQGMKLCKAHAASQCVLEARA